jgi:hypothetical protein
MRRVPAGSALLECLGEKGVRDLDDYVRDHGDAWRDDMVNAVAERLDYRLKECAQRDDVVRIETQMTEIKAELLRWTFVFWIGQVAAFAVLLSYMLQ